VTPARAPIPVAAGLGGADAAPSVIDAAARVSRAAADASRRDRRAGLRAFTIVGLGFIGAAFVWASWFAPWARGAPVPAAPAPAAPAPLTRADLDAALAPLRAAIDGVGVRVDRLSERSPSGPGR